tara:strand:- start:141 stop:1076 length:936 start_codon:yes stop_codon:yes gene_type:complete
MTKYLENRFALVTGGAQGIGLAIAKTLIKNGAKVAILDPGHKIDGTPENDNAVSKAIETLEKDKCIGIPCDVSNYSECELAIKKVIEHFGFLDIIINNAAILRDSFIFNANEEDFKKVISVNLLGPFNIIRNATPILKTQYKNGRGGAKGWGRIINITSTAGMYGNFGQAAYASSKAGLIGLTKVTAHDMIRSKVSCNAIAPFASSRVTKSIIPQNKEQEEYKQKALSISSNFVADMVSLLSGNLGSQITGQIIGVRAREIFLFDHPNIKDKIIRETNDIKTLEIEVLTKFNKKFKELKTDLEIFSSDPIN